jgi:chitin synthase
MDAEYTPENSPVHTRTASTTRRPGEASRLPIERSSNDVEAGLVGRRTPVQYDSSAAQGQSNQGGASGLLNRKRTLVRPERQRVDPTHRNYHYLQHTQQQHMHVQASTTGNRADAPIEGYDYDDEEESQFQYTDTYNADSPLPSPGQSSRTDLMRGKSILGRQSPQRIPLKREEPPTERHRLRKSKPGTAKRQQQHYASRAVMPWTIYCRTITCCFPGSLLRCFGIPGRAQQRAWREKIGLISVIIFLGAMVGFLTFGFTQAVCSAPPLSFQVNQITNGLLIIHGRAYDLSRSSHPAAIGVPLQSNVLYPPVNAGGLDASFMFQNVNSKCKGLVTATSNSSILQDNNGNLGWYFPCNLFKPDGSTTVNFTTGPYNGYACHTTALARKSYYNLRVEGEVVFDWDTLKNSSRNLVVYSGYVLLDVTNSEMCLIWICCRGLIRRRSSILLFSTICEMVL